MQYPALLTSDLHLDAHSSADYRFGLFPWLNEQIREERVKSLLILGDLTDKKDNHGAELVNRVVRAVNSIQCEEVKILAGNHDWLREGHEFFKFLNFLPHVEFITDIREDQDVRGQPTLYLPYTRDPARAWKDLDLSHYKFVFMHQTAPGSRASNGQLMDGDELPDLSAAGKIYSGDIHVPQVIGDIEYVGSPYHVHFGDDFKPRCVLLERGDKTTDLYFPSPKRVAVRAPSLDALGTVLAHETRLGDHIKLTLELDDGDRHDWLRIRRLALDMMRAAGLEIHGIRLDARKGRSRTPSRRQAASTPEEAVLRYVRNEELGGDALDTGLDVLEAR